MTGFYGVIFLPLLVLIDRLTLRIAKWALIRKEFSNFSLNDILLNWKAWMGCRPSKVRRVVLWSPPSPGVFKFNVDGATRGKQGLAGIGGVLRNSKGEVLFMFSKRVGVCDSNEAEVLASLEALRCFSRCFQGDLIVESDSSNAIAWVSNRKHFPWKFQFLFNEIRAFTTTINVVFRHQLRTTNCMADALAK